jgi:hypothetical protein
MDIDSQTVISIAFLTSVGLGLGFGLRFLKWMTIVTKNDGLTRVLQKPFVRLTLWLILGSLFAKPFMDGASLFIEFARIPYWFMRPISERSLLYGWEISYYSLYVGIRMLLFGVVYGYAIWAVPKIISMFVLEKGISINSRGVEGICIALTCGSVLHALVSSVAFSIQQFLISALFGNEDNAASFFFGWMIAFVLVSVILFFLNRIINKKIEPKTIMGVNLP